jgi:hypothetical protein
MATKVRKQIYIEPQQEALLKELKASTGMSEAEIIRESIAQHAHQLRGPRPIAAAWKEEREFISRLIEMGPVPGGRTWRREDLYDRKVLRRH